LFVNDKLSCEELASDIFVSLWLRRDTLSEIADFDNYFFVAAKNRALDFLRKKHEENLNIDDLPLDFFHYTETTPESIYISNETAQELNNAINTLSNRTRLAFHLVREEKKTYREAAEILSVSVKTIEKQVAAAVEKLKTHLKNKKSDFF
jgi:RNA polymerase sigma-70 factor (ECF subfamily)